ncbi:MAG: DnaJ domain-containing protein [Microcystis sp. M54BS1]|uniref:DnaJ domain-containing protein n=1 Tax=Microcystis TaxID=1125 RepID=UPI001231118C|nr:MULTISPECIES: DnaJ domain-containing protein [Microcystis]MCA2538043.1 DnaJ domain-containing protein [Microcystis sp. M54BS1]MCA2595100.1 DnaJ domain-containing protein [Microcystis sp. M38BS1]MCA2608830.1 DnaJ domain-containing protein [Microcystis sp. M27BS1]MCA2506037.1 DnaJ domain-containing protein [Microcystis sp. M62BS1]MCA2509059.1 DnaJ domain-containing protein [Microcystis sp. M60BS1]
MKDYYKLLDIQKEASEQEIEQAIRKQTRRWLGQQNHPDQQRRQEAERVMKELEEAKTILLDPINRQKYDRDLANQPIETHQVDENDLSQNADELIKEARELIAIGAIPEAIVVGERATQIAPNSADAWSVAARAKYLWGETRDADYEFKKAIKLRPNHAPFYFDYGLVLESSADSQKYKAVANSPDEALMKALEQYERAYSIDKQTTYLAAQGGIYINTPQYAKGIEIYERCVSLEPNEEEFKRVLAIAYVQVCHRNWTYVAKDNVYYATEIEQINETKLYIEKARNININDDTVTNAIKGGEELIAKNLNRKFLGSWFLAIIGGLVYLAISNNWFVPIILCVLYFVSCLVPQYAINKKVLTGKGASLMYYLISPTSNLLANFIIWAILGSFFPLIIIINFMINYWDAIFNSSKVSLPKSSQQTESN